MKKVPIEKFMWEKVKKPVTRTIKRACIVPCTKTITVPSCRVEYRDEEVTEDKDEWVKKCYTDYECVSDYEEFDCEERIKVPTWRLEDKQTNVCETMTSWQGKEVKNPKYVECNRPCTKTYNATIGSFKIEGSKTRCLQVLFFATIMCISHDLEEHEVCAAKN